MISTITLWGLIVIGSGLLTIGLCRLRYSYYFKQLSVLLGFFDKGWES